MWQKQFWIAAAERAIKTFAQALAAVLVAGATSILEVDWQQSLGVAALAAVLSVCTSVGSMAVGNAGPSLATEVVAPPTPTGPVILEDPS